MTAKEYLWEIGSMDREIDAKLEQAARLRALSEKVTTVFGDGKGGGGGGTKDLSGIVAKIIDLERAIDVIVDALVDRRREAAAQIEGMRDERERHVLEWRYLNQWGWVKIGMELKCSERQAQRIHGRALLKIRVP